MTILYAALGGAIGAALRYLVSLGVGFPYGTLVVNVIGSFLMGALFVLTLDRGFDRMVVFAMTGVLGGFTTFSAFSLDAFRLYEQGAPGAALGYVLGSVLLSLAAVVAGILLVRAVAT